MTTDGMSDIFRVLAAPQRRTMLHASAATLINRTSWACGCVADHIDAHESALHWEQCPAHRRPESLPRFTDPAGETC
jgi:hypothetical protein